MGCGGTKEEASNPQQQAGSAGTAGQRPPQQAAKPSNPPAGGEEWTEDNQVEFDDDLNLEINGVRCDKAGNNIGLYDRNEKRPDDNQGFFQVEQVGSGDQVLAVKPWIGAIVAPENGQQLQTSPPAEKYQLEYAYGYRCFDSRQNVFYTSNSNQVVYMTAAIGVVLDKNQNSQRFFGAGNNREVQGHTDDITALAISPSRNLVATGQVGKDPVLFVWSPSNPEGNPVCRMRMGRGKRAVTAVCFSNDESKVAAVGLDDDHTVTVFNAQSGAAMCSDKTGPDKVLDVAWSQSGNTFCTVGIKHVCFWECAGGALTKKKGLFGKAGPMCNMTSVAFLSNGKAVSGGTNGMVYLWEDRNCVKAVDVHGRGNAVHTIKVEGNRIFSGGKDNNVIELDQDLNKVGNPKAIGSCPRAIDFKDNNLLVGSRDGKIQEFGSSGTKVLMQSHCDGEVWGLAVNPSNPDIVITTGDDNTIRAWNIRERKCVGSGPIDPQKGQERRPGYGASTLATTTPNQQARAVAINSNGDVAVGHNDGKVTIRSADNLANVKKTLNDPKEWIQAMAFSPDGSKLAVGSHDNRVYIYDVGSYNRVATCSGHSSFITGLDWSTDSTCLHTVCGAYELLFWDASNGSQKTSGATELRNEEWSTWSTILGWPVQGIFGGIIDYTHVNSVDRSPDKSHLIVGNDYGFVEVFRYPNGEGAQSDAYRAHSEHVTNVKYRPDASYIFSAGGYDQTVMQWKRV